MVRLGALWRKAAALLEQAGVEDAAFDARELCRLCCKADPLLAPDFPVPEAAQQRLAQLCARRARHEPLQYLLGEWDFLDFTVEVGPGVLIPRADTECVAQTAVAALTRAAARPGREDEPAGLDLCAGTGVLAIALARGVPAARVTAVEKSGEAFSFLQRNCAALAPRVAAVQADVFGYENTLAPHSVDVIVSNPPYVTAQDYEALAPELRFEPREALPAAPASFDAPLLLPAESETPGTVLVELDYRAADEFALAGALDARFLYRDEGSDRGVVRFRTDDAAWARRTAKNLGDLVQVREP